MPDSYLPGRARRDYQEFKKPVLDRNKEGEIVFVKVKNPGGTPDSVPVYLFECIHTQARDVQRLYKPSRQKTWIFLASTTGVIHVSLDVWTDLNTVPWLGVICYLVHKGKYKRFTLDFIRIRGNHTGVALAQALYDCLVVTFQLCYHH
ncbi:hypothetical protein B0H14DRAFT_3424284 [Mycena olivaceomarginata]|nr:hypothetical protein B0H14DRAFT_3424284 [Mycena olivaceomarginata]